MSKPCLLSHLKFAMERQRNMQTTPGVSRRTEGMQGDTRAGEPASSQPKGLAPTSTYYSPPNASLPGSEWDWLVLIHRKPIWKNHRHHPIERLHAVRSRPARQHTELIGWTRPIPTLLRFIRLRQRGSLCSAPGSPRRRLPPGRRAAPRPASFMVDLSNFPTRFNLIPVQLV